MKKNGNTTLILGCLFLGYVAGVLYIKNNRNIKNVVSNSDIKIANRLKEFYFEDYNQAVKKYVKYIGMGLSPEEAFDTVICLMPVELITIGDIND